MRLGKRARPDAGGEAGSPIPVLSVLSAPSTRACSPAAPPGKQQPKRARVTTVPVTPPYCTSSSSSSSSSSSARSAWALDIPAGVWSTVCRFLSFAQTARLSNVSTQLRAP